ncbi:MAG: hypothetical protein DCC58_11010 [Chloroflexi bacterium]|nr:MAG: hypothetical protein DCC58_11010 [Chloroflexota bacterium]
MSPLTVFVSLLGMYLLHPALFRRKRERPGRAAALDEVFTLNARLNHAAAHMKPEWTAQWEARTSGELPPRYALLDAAGVAAVHELRFTRALLQRNRWRSQVEPIFTDADGPGWRVFAATAGETSRRLLHIREEFAEHFLADELDWLDAAIEQFDDAWRLVQQAERQNEPLPRRAADGTYLHLYLVMQLAERFVDRLSQETARDRR